PKKFVFFHFCTNFAVKKHEDLCFSLSQMSDTKLVVAMPCNEEGDEEERSVFIRAAKSASGIPHILSSYRIIRQVVMDKGRQLCRLCGTKTPRRQ
ncbi:MAG: hypothetical protein SPF16_00710, partial [Prevotella sp.]|nr:hypothetical protein [Prevotella sp.]